MSTYYSGLEVTPTVQDWITEYIGPANRLVAKYGGKYLARTDVMNVLRATLNLLHCVLLSSGLPIRQRSTL